MSPPILSREERAVLAAWERVQQKERKECARQRLEQVRSSRHAQVRLRARACSALHAPCQAHARAQALVSRTCSTVREQ
jgi:hypothetical protein